MLDGLSPRPRSRQSRKRVGRGPGSGLQKTCGRGTKGQGKRGPGRETALHFEGGQMPLVRRLPKRGFHSLFRTSYRIVNVGALSGFGEGASVDPQALEAAGLIHLGALEVKLLAEGTAPRNLKVRVHKASAAAARKIEAAGGSVELIA